jgi:hypothetical protein
VQTKLIKERVAMVSSYLAKDDPGVAVVDGGGSMPLIDLIAFSYAFEECIPAH